MSQHLHLNIVLLLRQSFSFSLRCIPLLFTINTTAVAATEEAKSFYVKRKSYGTPLETEPPKYVKQLNKIWLKEIDGLEDTSWLDIGLDYRIRFEHRNNDFRRAREVIDEPILLRTLAISLLKIF